MAGKDIQQLMKKKDAIEEEIKVHTKILEIVSEWVPGSNT